MKRSRPRRRTTFLTILTLLLGTLSMLGTAAPAHAASTCNGSTVSGKFTPGIDALDMDNQAFEVAVTSAVCTTSNPDITSARMEGHGSGPFSCTTGEIKGKGTIFWNDGSSNGLNSTVEWTLTNVTGGNLIQGTVKSGEFKGEKFRVEAVGGSNPTECTKPNGLKSFAATGSMQTTPA
ncbi:hypothetical protein [Streptomyces halobius]|uniref:Ig-like domain-containing protein n=1 Tax=Streptomyces halobius TaxID=2879846 RepID=A0ABY4MGG4_9ACTN|nr:hypothetical protein [Streptomyces halobius]UQA95804.1 hypothetical protein K9S39_31560 [Streptomyces halobius]